MEGLVWVKKTEGLNTRVAPETIEWNEKEGCRFLPEAVDVDISRYWVISRRKGFSVLDDSGAYLSLFWAGGDCLGVRGNTLGIVGSDFSFTPLRENLSNGDMSFWQFGDVILYMNGVEGGVVKAGKSHAFVKPPKELYPDPSRVYDDPPTGHIVRHFAGRVYVAKNNTLFYSEPFGPNLFSLSRNYISFPGWIQMVAPVFDGIFVGTRDRVYFLAGTNPVEFTQSIVAHYGVIRGTDQEVDGMVVAGGQITPFPCQIFATRRGICLGAREGQFINLTFDRLEYPAATKGCAVYTGNKYLLCLQDSVTVCIELWNLAISQYTNYSFSALCKFGDIMLGGDGQGLFKILEGSTDEGELINGYFVVGPSDFGSENEKRLRRLYFGLKTEGSLLAEVTGSSSQTVKREVVGHKQNLELHNQQVSGGRDIRGRYLTLKVSNDNGCDFTVNEIRAVLIPLSAKTTEVSR